MRHLSRVPYWVTKVLGDFGAMLMVADDPGKGSIQLSADNLGLGIEPHDPFGNYKITAEIIDKVSGTQILLSTRIAVVANE